MAALTIDLKVLRERSVAIAKDLGCGVSPSLPLLDEKAALRSKDSVEKRALCVHVVVAVSCGFPGNRALEWILREGLTESLAPSERELLRSPKRSARSFQSQAEALWVFAWLFSRIEVLDFTTRCSDTLVTLYPDLKAMEAAAPWQSKNEMRGFQEVMQATDLAYCLHWVSTEQQLGAHRRRALMSLPAIVERRRALEWIVGGQDWDQVALDT